MINHKGIVIKNIYYMLSYAFQVLKQKNYDEVEAENFDEVEDLFAAILAKGVAQQLKQGLYREYVTHNEHLTVMRGKINLSGTIQNKIQRNQRISCEYDELSENNLFNQILKTTLYMLMKHEGVAVERKNAMHKVLLFFGEVDLIEPSCIRWNKIRYQRNNRNYEMLINICFLVIDGLIQTTEQGHYKMTGFSDEHMERLYEKFILEFYKKHHGYLSEIKAGQIQWNLEGKTEEAMIRFLPVMQSDILLRYQDEVLIIDAKYYGKTLQKHFDKYSLHSNNLYQIFTYVKNHDKDNTGKVSGLLLYAKTEEEVTPDCLYNMGGNKIGAQTLDLNREFYRITDQLNSIVSDFFGAKLSEMKV